MKKIIQIISCIGLATLISCSSDYLNTTPNVSVDRGTAFSTTEMASLVVNGMAKIMKRQESTYGQGYNGEGTVKMFYGNYQGAAFVYPATGWTNTVTGAYHTSSTSTYTAYPWFYYYQIVAAANEVVTYIDGAVGSDSEKARIKAQGLTYRAYAYTMLIQLYGHRWQDSNNGADPGVVLRLEPFDPTVSTDMPLSTVGDTYKQIYQDLDEAITLFKSSDWTRKSSDFWTPNLEVAYATYARAAIAKRDFDKAIECARLARNDHPLMSVSEYKSGFNTANNEWIWGSYDDDVETLYYYSFFCYLGWNSNATQTLNYPKCINRAYYDKLPLTDIRRDFWLDPTGYTISSSTGEASSSRPLFTETHAKYPEMSASAKVFGWMQFKFKAKGMPGIGHLAHFRASEMYLIEAEGLIYKGGADNEEAARQLLIELTATSGRDPSYTLTSTGDDLLNDYKFIAQIELWGEGLDWFMIKRWRDPIVRKSFANGGNYVSAYNGTTPPEGANNQTWVIPNKETDYNSKAKGLATE